MPNLSTELTQLITEQMSHELYNAQLYLKIGAWLKNKGLDNIGKHFYETQVAEEHGHQKKFSDYLVDRNIPVMCLDVPAVDISINSLQQISFLYLKQEQDTTAKLKNIATQALSEGDFMTFDFMMEMIRYQRDEEEEAITFQDRANMCKSDSDALMWNQTF